MEGRILAHFLPLLKLNDRCTIKKKPDAPEIPWFSARVLHLEAGWLQKQRVVSGTPHYFLGVRADDGITGWCSVRKGKWVL